uniref:Intraflagellar transport protein 27 homolog n=1 Tax=Phallusia mammillata TaxID=59560 RepID=A0A6F9DFN8_9ASCI|nr:intraflagellar transport protein 27 homolog [Phallusia mammillata]
MVVLHGKCVVVGEPTVGKSAVSQSFSADGTAFPKNYTMTIGVELSQKNLQVGENAQDLVNLFIFDSSGKEVFSDLSEPCWEKLSMFAVVFDVTNSKSFTSCQRWLKKLKKYFEPSKSIPGVLIGNKTDLEARRKISAEDATNFAQEHSLTYFECSAKDYVGIDAPFRHLAQKFLDLHQESNDLVQQFE